MKTTHLTRGALLTALTIIFLYLAALFPTNTLTFLTLASFMVPIGVMQGSIKTAFLIYVSSSFLSFFIMPLNIALLYALFFGIYGLVKYFIERINSLPKEIFFKLTFFNAVFFILINIMQGLAGFDIFKDLEVVVVKYLPEASASMTLVFVWFLAQIGFMILDYALTLLIAYYNDYFSKIKI